MSMLRLSICRLRRDRNRFARRSRTETNDCLLVRHRDTMATWRRSSARTLAGTLVGGLEIICAATRAASPRSPAFVILGSPRRHGEAW